MIRSTPWVLGFVLLTGLANPAWAQRRGNSNVVTPYGTFSSREMLEAGGDLSVASQMREQRQMMQYQQQMYRQNQAAMKDQIKQQEFAKKHPEAAKALNPTGRTSAKSTSKADKKAKSAAPTSTPATTSAPVTPPSTTAKAKTKKAS